MSKAKVAVAYCRVSQASQTEGDSLANQQAKIEEWCQKNGYSLIASFEDAGISGTSMKRRLGLRDALDLACREKAALVCYSITRAARSLRDSLDIAERLRAAGADLVSVDHGFFDTTSPQGKLIFGLLSLISEFERDMTSQRTKDVLAYKRARGESAGGRVPYGFSRVQDGVHANGKPRMVIVPNPHEQDAIRQAVAWAEDGWTWDAIGRMLPTRGYLPRNGGKRWRRKLVGDLLAAHRRICDAA